MQRNMQNNQNNSFTKIQDIKGQEVSFDYKLDEVFKHIKTGAFLTTQYAGENNVMTIGWAQIGIIWGKPILSVLVRKSRHTKTLLDNSGEFSVSVPFDDKLKQALTICGTKSGKNFDKIKELNLPLFESEKINTPCINCKGLHFECLVLCKTDIKAENLDLITSSTWYKDGDFHTIYFAEIVRTLLI